MLKLADFGKDHWSLLGYIEYRCINGNKGIGTLDIKTMSSKNREGWQDSYGTRLSGFFLPNKQTNEERRLKNHDDMDCLEDLENLELIEIISLVNLFIKLTDKGIKILAQLGAHKSKGGYFSNFDYTKKYIES